MKNRHSRLDWEEGHNIRPAAFALHTWAGRFCPSHWAGRWAARQGGGQKRARSHFNPGTLPVQSVIACCLAHFPPARSQPKNSTLPAWSAIHLLRPSLLRLGPPFTSFGRASSGFARHSPPSAAPPPASPVIHLLRPRLFRLRPPFTSFGRASSGFARHSPPSAEPPPASPVIHLLRPHLFRFRPSFTPFGRTSRFARHSLPSAAPPVLFVIHPLRPRFPFCSSFTSFGRASSGIARHSRLGREAGHNIRGFSLSL